jgi:hypothetical protein
MKAITAVVLMLLSSAWAEESRIWPFQPRIWSFQPKTTVKGSLLEFSGTNRVVIQGTDDDKTYVLPISKLSADDQEFLEKLRYEQATAQDQPHGPIFSAVELCYFGSFEFEGVTYSFGTTGATFKATPNWNKSDDFPPLSPRKAISAALGEAKRIRPDVSEWRAETVTLDEIQNHWFYRVECARNDKVGTGIHLPLTVPVLMDGTAVHGEVSPR